SDLFTVVTDRGGVFRGGPDLLLVAKEAIRCGDACGVKNVVALQIVELEENTEGFRVWGIVRKGRAHFLGSQREFTEADIGGRDGFDLVSENERARVESAFFILGNAKGRFDDADVSRFDVFHDDVETVEAWVQRN